MMRHTRAYAAALLNLSGLGLGFIYLRAWRPLTAYLVFLGCWSLAVLVLATDQRSIPGELTAEVSALGLGVLIATGVALRIGLRKKKGPARPRPTPLVVAGVILVVVVGAVSWYRDTAADRLAEAREQHGGGNCVAASRLYAPLTDVYVPAFVADADRIRDELAACRHLIDAQGAAAAEDPVTTVKAFDRYLASRGARAPGIARDAAYELRMEHAGSWARRGVAEAIANYVTAASYVDPGSEGGRAVIDATGTYAERVTKGFDSGSACEVIGRLDAIAGTTSYSASPARETAVRRLPTALATCAQRLYDTKKYSSAAQLAARLGREFPKSPLVSPTKALAARANIKAAIARAKDGEHGYLSEPGPDQYLGATTGPVTVSISNGTDSRLDLLWTGPSTGRATIEPSGGSCDDAPVAQKSLTFPSGRYEVVARSRAAVDPFYGTWDLEPEFTFSSCFYIDTVDRYDPYSDDSPLPLPPLDLPTVQPREP